MDASQPKGTRTTGRKLLFVKPRRDDFPAAGGAEGFVETPDHQALHYRIFGREGPLLVLCDGVGCDGYIWKYLIPDLMTDHQILHWQYRGHGQSSASTDYARLTVVQMASDLECLLRTLGEEGRLDAAKARQPILIGHSMGSQVILEFHQRYGRERMGALVVVCGAAGQALDRFMHSPVMKALFPYLLQFFRLFPEFASLVWTRLIATPHGYYPAVLFQLTSTLCGKEDLQPYLDHLARIDSRVFMELAGDMGRHTVVEHLPDVDVPTLVFAGSRDNFTPVEFTRQIAERVPGAEFCLIRGATHTAPLELPELIVLRLRKFLSEKMPRSSWL